MKILLINKFYYLKGGAEKYLFALEKLLLAKGYEVRILACRSPKNLFSADQDFFIGLDDLDALPWYKKITEVVKIFYRPETIKKLNLMLKNWQPDLVHLNNINYQISTNIIDYFAKKKIPLVITLHDYQLLSPNYTLYNPRLDSPASPKRGERQARQARHDCAQAALDKKFYQCLLHRCYQNSFLKTLLAVLESYYNHGRKVYQKINAFIAPSIYLAEKFGQAGFNKKKIHYLPNFLEVTSNSSTTSKSDFYLYAGRLTEEKGLKELVEFFVANPKYHLCLAGAGDFALPKAKNIDYLGQLTPLEINTVLHQAKALIFPSKWPENCPYIILEALAAGRPIIAKDVGGVKELVVNNRTGLLFNNFSELKNILEKFETDPNFQEYLAKNSLIESLKYSSELYYDKLIKLYLSLINK